jgi:hypothetical protein
MVVLSIYVNNTIQTFIFGIYFFYFISICRTCTCYVIRNLALYMATLTRTRKTTKVSNICRVLIGRHFYHGNTFPFERFMTASPKGKMHYITGKV